MRCAEHLAFRVIEGRAFVVDPRAKVLHSFNEVGTRIWQLIGTGKSSRAIAEALSEEFDVDAATASKDVDEFLRELSAKGLLAS